VVFSIVKPVLRSTVFVLLWIGVQGCTSFYSAAVLGHDALEVPFPERGNDQLHSDVAFSLKTSPTVSYFTRDSTQSGMLGATLFTSFPASPNGRFCIAVTGSGYVASTFTYVPQKDKKSTVTVTTENTNTSYGYTGEVKLGFILDEGEKSGVFTGIDLIYNQEFGDYLSFRKKVTGTDRDSIYLTSDSSPVNLSPIGRTLEGYFFLGKRFRLSGNEFIDLLAAPGVAFTNWPYEHYFSAMSRLTGIYSLSRFWWSLSLEDLNFLNVGLGVGFGVRL